MGGIEGNSRGRGSPARRWPGGADDLSDAMSPESRIAERWQSIEGRICDACAAVGRDPEGVGLVAVSKGRSAPEIAAAARAGLQRFGESRPQEFREKFALLEDLELGIEWHFVGRLQPNKVRLVVGACTMIHSVDDADLAETIDDRSRSLDIVTPVLVQVNLSGESTKGGVDSGEAGELLATMRTMAGIRPVGLMTMAPDVDDAEEVRPLFRGLAELAEQLRGELDLELPHLSMGMTGDFEVAVQEGATLVRIGRALFE